MATLKKQTRKVNKPKIPNPNLELMISMAHTCLTAEEMPSTLFERCYDDLKPLFDSTGYGMDNPAAYQRVFFQIGMVAGLRLADYSDDEIREAVAFLRMG